MGPKPNCGIAHILGILLTNSYDTGIFFSNYYNLQSVHFKLIWNEKCKAILYHVDISRQYVFVYQLKIMFYFLHELKQRSCSNITGWHKRLVDSDVTEGVKTTQSNRLKFRLFRAAMLDNLGN